MAPKPFIYQDPFPIGKEKTEYYLLTKDFVSVEKCGDREILKVEPEGITALARTAMRDCNFLLRPEHQKQVAHILADPEASENDKFVAITMLRNAEIAAKGVLPFCQDTGTATVYAKKAIMYGPTAPTKKPSPKAFTKLTHRKTCATRKMRRSICTTR